MCFIYFGMSYFRRPRIHSGGGVNPNNLPVYGVVEGNGDGGGGTISED